jgi:hypothetical protein
MRRDPPLSRKRDATVPSRHLLRRISGGIAAPKRNNAAPAGTGTALEANVLVCRAYFAMW